MKRGLLVGVLLAAVLVLAACGGGAASNATPTPATETITVVAHDLYFGDTNDNATNPPKWTVTSGAQVSVVFENKGALQHNFAVLKLGETLAGPMYDETKDAGKLLFNEGVIDPGKTETKTFTAPAPGEYTVICTVAGHYPSMQGRLVVQ